MNNIIKLTVGELKRLLKYKILVFGVIVSLIWVIIIALTNKEDIEPYISILIGMDASIMSILLLGASYYFERQEGTIKTTMVAPVSVSDVLISKVISATIMSLISAYLVAISVLIFHGIKIDLFLLLVYILIVIISHSAIAFTICLYAKDFGSMMGYFGLFMLISFIPVLLEMVNLIPEGYEMIFLILPFKSSEILFKSLIFDVELIYIVIAILYLVLLGGVLYNKVVYKQFKKYVVEG